MLRYIGHRLLVLIPTLIAVSIVSFIIIQLPPGDFLTSYISNLEASGVMVPEQEIAALRRQYGLGQPIYVQYAKWVWGMLQGDFGRSFRWNAPVADLIWGRLGLTVLISASTLIFTWLVSVPVGIYSAVKQYSIGDYIATAMAFVGAATPNFLFALVLMVGSYVYLGHSVGGLFSPEFVDAPWSWARVVDLLQHLWVPVVVLGTSGTAYMVRVLRANLLDELGKPYVTTARAKGQTERKVLMRYPVRAALDPLVSTIGWSLAGLVSGSMIVAVVLDLPTTGPLLLQALVAQDMYLAGSFIMLVSVLTLIGTLISDILLAWLNPRIRLRMRE